MNIEDRLIQRNKQIRARGLVPVVLAYGRKSVVRGVEDLISTRYQYETCKRFADRWQWKMEWYVDDKRGHQSGRGEKNRPEWARLKAQIGRQEVIAVICENTRAVFRNVKLILEFLDQHVEKSALEFIDLTMPTNDVKTGDGRAMLTVKSSFDESESRRTSERMSYAIKTRVNMGKHWGAIPTGLTHDKDKKLIRSDAGYKRHGKPTTYFDTVREFIERYLETTRGADAIAEQMNAEGYKWRGRNGKPVPVVRDHVIQIIRYPHRYRGFIDARLLARIEQKRKRNTKGERTPRHTPLMLRNLLVCAKCGAPFHSHYISSHGQPRPFYEHARDRFAGCPEHCAIIAHKLDDQMRAWIAKHLRIGGITRADIHRVRSRERRPPPFDRTVIEKKLERLNELYVEGRINRARYDARRTAFEAQLAEPEKPATIERTDEEIERILQDVVSLVNAPTADPAKVNAFLREIIARIQVRGKRIIKVELQAGLTRVR